MIEDEPGAPLAGHISPNPLQEDAQPEARCGEELEVHRGPSEPSSKTAQLDLVAFEHRKTFPHYRHSALIKVAKQGS
jgi:hypothetical protein